MSISTEFKDELYHALSRNQFVLCYEPQLNLKTKTITSVEALVRWCHPERGMLRPAEFLALAEDTDVIIPLGEWVLKEACLVNKKWQDQGYKPISMSVNLAPKQFHHPHITETIEKVLNTTQLDPRYLILEITEMTVMENIPKTQQFLHHLRSLGISLAVDDFGTGNTSITYLQDFPINILKIDKSFIQAIPANEENTEIVCRMIELAHKLGAKVVAEGVWLEEQINFLTEQGCDMAQGSIIGAPQQADEVEKLLKK